MIYIRRKDNPLLIKAFGYGPSGSLGEFDPTLYEEIEAENLPVGSDIESASKNLAQQLNEIFQAQSPETRAQFYTIKAALKIALEEGDTLAAYVMIDSTSVSPELQSIKAQMLSLFPQ